MSGQHVLVRPHHQGVQQSCQPGQLETAIFSLIKKMFLQIYPMSGGSHHRLADTAEFYIKDRRGGGCRKFCFGLYFIVTWSVVAMVLLMIWMAPR